ncbi:MAG: hypothetical protein ABIG37_00400, partial [Nanoarchaeota archaeon]
MIPKTLTSKASNTAIVEVSENQYYSVPINKETGISEIKDIVIPVQKVSDKGIVSPVEKVNTVVNATINTNTGEKTLTSSKVPNTAIVEVSANQYYSVPVNKETGISEIKDIIIPVQKVSDKGIVLEKVNTVVNATINTNTGEKKLTSSKVPNTAIVEVSANQYYSVPVNKETGISEIKDIVIPVQKVSDKGIVSSLEKVNTVVNATINTNTGEKTLTSKVPNTAIVEVSANQYYSVPINKETGISEIKDIIIPVQKVSDKGIVLEKSNTVVNATINTNTGAKTLTSKASNTAIVEVSENQYYSVPINKETGISEIKDIIIPVQKVSDKGVVSSVGKVNTVVNATI